jgi:hypothetical protein
MSFGVVVSSGYKLLGLSAMSNNRSIDTKQTSRRHIGDQVPIERNGGARPRLLMENAANPALSFNDTADTPTVQSNKRLLEE